MLHAMRFKEAPYQRMWYVRVGKVKYALLESGVVEVFKVLVLKTRDVSICVCTHLVAGSGTKLMLEGY